MFVLVACTHIRGTGVRVNITVRPHWAHCTVNVSMTLNRLWQLRHGVQGALARPGRREDAQREDPHAGATAGLQK